MPRATRDKSADFVNAASAEKWYHLCRHSSDAMNLNFFLFTEGAGFVDVALAVREYRSLPLHLPSFSVWEQLFFIPLGAFLD